MPGQDNNNTNNSNSSASGVNTSSSSSLGKKDMATSFLSAASDKAKSDAAYANSGMSQEEIDKAQKHDANKKTAKTAAKAAGAYFGGSAGAKAVDMAANTKAGQKILDKGADVLDKNRLVSNMSKKLNDVGATDLADKAIDASSSGGSGGVPGGAGGVSGGSGGVPGASSLGNSSPTGSDNSSIPRDSILDDKSDSNDDSSSKSSKGTFEIKGMKGVIVVVSLISPFLLLVFLIVVVVALVSGIFGEFDDAFGMSQTLGEETGGVNYVSSSVKQELYDKIAIVKTSYQSSGKTVDAMKIIAVFHVLKNNGANIDYDTVKESEVRSWADAMLKNGSYDEETFKNNLVNSIIPKYIKKTNKAEREALVKEILDYIDNYNDFIGKNEVSVSCGSVGSCNYDIKGFSINGTNVSKSMQISDLKVRLMECSSPYGNGDYNKAIDQDLVDFEDYVAGVAYAEIGDSAPLEAIKAQMVAARSFALSRPTSMNNALGKKLEQENGQWILQISSCVADQVFCNIDQGCSFMGGGDGQGGICRSGKVSGAVRTRDALPEDSPIRKAITETQGEVLVNDQGYIIHTGYLSTEQNMWMSLANSGKNYKQILLQTYNQGSRDSAATDVKKASCGGSSKSCASNGEYASWRQGDPQWGSIQMGDSGSTIHQIGCLVTSVSILMAKSGVETSISPLNPGTFVEFLNAHGGFVGGGNYVWGTATIAAPKFVYKGQIYVSGMSREEKLNKIKELVSQDGVYAVAEVKGNTGQHWVAIDGVDGSVVKMIDPASDSNDMWSQYNWANTSTLAYYKVE